MLNLYFTWFERPLPTVRFEQYLDEVPLDMKERVLKFRRWEDAHANLFGKILLKAGLKDIGVDDLKLEDIVCAEFDRPFFPDSNIDFNISHTDSFVACVISDSVRVGFDVERLRKIGVEDFSNLWTEEEWGAIRSDPDDLRAFYSAWTQKEALIKADGRGIQIPLKEIIIRDHSATIDETKWYLKEVKLMDGYVSHLATDEFLDMDVRVKQMDFR